MSTAAKARKDAQEYARARMFYGEGAGTRRKLITATVQGRSAADPLYAREFNNELARQDMAEHAAKARRERQVKDVSTKTSKTFKNVATGNYQNLSSGLFIAVTLATVAHKTGLDKQIHNKGKEVVRDIKRRHKTRQARRAADKLLRPPASSA